MPTRVCASMKNAGMRVLQILQFRREPFHGPVQSYGLHVQRVDEAPQQRFPFVG